MIDFQGTTHLLKNPTGTYSAVGAVPVTCLALREPTRADVMAGRIVETPEGRKGWTVRSFTTADELRAAIVAGGAETCSNPRCACANVR